MARIQDRERARVLRKQGKSYSEIKELLGIGKGTLSIWLRDMPLSDKQLRELRDLNPKRIEKYRETRRRQREARLDETYKKASIDIGTLTRRELFLTGLFLYWGEGTKSSKGTVVVANTDPKMIRAFIKWLKILGIKRSQLKVKLHLYRDMDLKKEISFWAKELRIPLANFRPPYIKDSNLANISYKNGHGHGTCNVIFENMPLWEYIMMALKRIREMQ